MSEPHIESRPAMTAIRKGFRFLHVSWKDSRRSLAEMKSLPPEETAQEFIVTKVARGVIYYRPVYRHGDREEYGHPFVCGVDELSRYVLTEVAR